ncbi:LysE family translocator [Rubrimonas sp.]|uniref:LysE family translocator n=1 Tax=Rubrimonas sp. TaxID=2036015 RepID=UPI002FDDDCAF
MTAETWLALLLFATVACITPGPGNTLMMSSGLRRGIVATLPLLAGINVGFMALLAAVGAGLGAVIIALPGAALALKLAGGCYILWLALRLARAGPPRNEQDGALPSFGGGFLLQWLNGKAWLMAVGAVAAYVRPEAVIESLGIVAATFLVIGVAANLLWTAGGAMLRPLLMTETSARRANAVLAGLLAVSAVPILLS